jgi:uncharacterized membrane protein
MGELEELKKQVEQHTKDIQKISNRLTTLELVGSQNTYAKADSDDIADTVDIKNTEKQHKRPKKEKKSEPINLFKLFGIVGVIMILLGTVYFYKYAVDQGWIGITGRIVLGVLVSLAFIGIGFAMNKKYEKFSHIVIGGGLGTLYFTLFSTYHFETFRNALGMTLIANTLILLFIMIAGTIIGIKLNARFVVYLSLLMGYIAAFLSGIDGKTLHILIFALIVSIVVLIIARMKKWYLGIPAQVLTYIAYLIWYIQGVTNPDGIVAQTNSPVLLTFLFLYTYYILFTVLSFIQASQYKEGECIALSVINSFFLSAFGLGIINEYYPDFNGLYLMITAAITLGIGFISQKYNFKKIFDIHFLMTLIIIAIAIPVQFDNTIVTLLWVLMMVGLSYAGLQIEHKNLFWVGYLGFILCFLRFLFVDLGYSNPVERWIGSLSVLIGLIFLQVIVSKKYSFEKAKRNVIFNIYSVVGLALGMIFIAREITDINAFKRNMQTALISVAWAVYSIVQIVYGISMKRKLFNWCGIILFGIVILKVVTIDISSLDNIYRVLALVGVGALALVGSYAYTRNKDSLKEFM